MRPKYKNQIFNYLLKMGWDINDFEIQDSTEIFEIQYKGTPLCFRFYFPISFDSFIPSYVTYSPNWYHDKERQSDWSATFSLFEDWLKEHVKLYIEDLNTLDLWDEYIKSNNAVCYKNIDFDSLENFTPEEQQQLQMSINELKGLIIDKFQLQVEQQKIVNERLDYLITATTRLNKFDWKGVVVNTIISLIIALAFDSEKANQFIELFKVVFHGMKNILPLN